MARSLACPTGAKDHYINAYLKKNGSVCINNHVLHLTHGTNCIFSGECRAFFISKVKCTCKKCFLFC